ncbi:hypothetical protein [Mesorhizobium sp. LSHC414A00]|uniref:hypothetical protein n=1 Tax=Mesorhizobium sp. LSHC414A00 TaxID=1287287 RepID=UPI0003CF2A14|nr:hypothetical protein [Mesorhizobium sp. LSHC414A00]ESX79988.1 hypothetical protein X757_03190 [Mesorhizobium sp. LSHC414A00]
MDNPGGFEADRLLALEDLPRVGAVAVYCAGSAIDGLGNAWSDIDLYVIGSCEPAGDCVIDNGSHRVSIHYLEGRRIDFEFWQPAWVQQIADKLTGFTEDQLGEEVPLTGAEQKFVHRLLHSRTYFGDLAPWLRRFDSGKLARMQRYACVRQTDHLHEDICGMLESGDYASAALLCRLLLDHALGAVLHALGNTIATKKWWPRISGSLLAEDTMLHEWWALQFPDIGPPHSASDTLRGYAIDCILLAERLVTRAQE